MPRASPHQTEGHARGRAALLNRQTIPLQFTGHRRLCGASQPQDHRRHRSLRCLAQQRQQQQQQQRTASSQRPLEGGRLARTLVTLFVLGAVIGPPLDGIHTNVDLLLYDKLPITIGTWKTSLADPLLLGTYYAVAGALVLALDEFSGSAEDEQRISAHSSPAWVALSFGLLAAYLQLSSTMYAAGVPYSQIWAVLLAVGTGAWTAVDGTKQGLALALVSAAVCPAAEILLMEFVGLWHYPSADVFGITSWTACCYAIYTVVVCNLARCVSSRLSGSE